MTEIAFRLQLSLESTYYSKIPHEKRSKKKTMNEQRRLYTTKPGDEK